MTRAKPPTGGRGPEAADELWADLEERLRAERPLPGRLRSLPTRLRHLAVIALLLVVGGAPSRCSAILFEDEEPPGERFLPGSGRPGTSEGSWVALSVFPMVTQIMGLRILMQADPVTGGFLYTHSFLGVAVKDWLLALGVWWGVTLFLWLVLRLVRKRFLAFAVRTKTRVDDVLAEALDRTASWFLIAVGAFFALPFLGVDLAGSAWIRRVMFLLLLLQCVRWCRTIIRSWVVHYSETHLDRDAAAVTSVRAIGFLLGIGMWVVVVLLALENFGVDITALVAGLGIGGIAVALALQNILGDLFASLSIVLDKPFVIGDFLVLGDYLGVVENIGLKTTRIRSLSGEQIVVSNSDLLKSRIRNYKRMFERRVAFEIGVVYGTPLETVRRIPEMLREIVTSRVKTRFDRAHFKAWGDSSLRFEVVYYVLAPDYALYMDIQQAINLAIGEAFERDGIEFAFPTRTVHLADPRHAEEPAASNAS